MVYDYEIWVPRDRLYEFLALLNRHIYQDEDTILYWPDGRTLKFRAANQDTNDIPFDCSFADSFYADLLFEPDDTLATSNYEFLPLLKKYVLKNIGVFVDLTLRQAWLDEEPHCALIGFTPDQDMGEFFGNSLSIRRFFVDLSREGQAVSCAITCESGRRLLFLDGQETDKIGEFESHFPYLRYLLDPTKDSSENEDRLFMCQASPYSDALSYHDLMSIFEWAQNSNDSGVRSAACGALVALRPIESEQILCKLAIEDEDWRVRYTAISYLSFNNSIQAENALFDALNDENYQVRAAAIEILEDRENLKATLAARLKEVIAQLELFGPSMDIFVLRCKPHLSLNEPM